MNKNLLDLDKVNKNIIKEGLQKYLYIIKEFSSLNEPTREFTRRFNNFYRIRQGSKFYETFYSLMFQYKNKNVEFGDILKILFKEIGKVESSYTSKLLHTINPNKPIWDKFVLMNLGLKQNTNSKDKINYSINTYSKIESFTFNF